MLDETPSALHDLPDAPQLVEQVCSVPSGSVAPIERDVAGGPSVAAGADGLLTRPTIPLTGRVVPLGEIVPLEPVDLLTFFEPRTIGGALAAAGWTPTRDIELLAQIAETGESDKDRILAMRELRLRVRESLESTGELGKFGVSETEDDSGATKRTVSVSSGLTSTLGALAEKFKRNKAPEESVGGPPPNKDRPDSQQVPVGPAPAVSQDVAERGPDGLLHK